MKKIFLAACLFWSSVTFASVTINFTGAEINDAAGSSVGLGTVGILVVDSSGNGFSGSTANTFSEIVGLSLTEGVSIGDDTILKVFTASDLGGAVGFASSLVGYDYAGAIGGNDKLAIYWFPGITTIGGTVQSTQAEVGFYRSDSVDVGADIGFVLPTSDGTYNMGFFSTNFGGSVTPSSLNAFNTTPEPSRVLFLALGGMGLLMRRRRA